MNSSEKQILDNISQDFGSAASQYQKSAKLQQQIAQDLISPFKDKIHKEQNIIDLGCGNGTLANILNGYDPQKFYQIDIAKEMCDLARQNNCQTKKADFHNLPFTENKFDLILSASSLQWSYNLDKCFQEIKRIAKDNAKIAICFFVAGSLSELSKINKLLTTPIEIHKFPTKQHISSAHKTLSRFGCKISYKKYQEEFPNLISCLKGLKAIGARAKNNKDQKFLGKGFYGNLENCDKILHNNQKQNFKISWNVVIIKNI
jgi:malonyl-CoA O-methyltransferase